MEVSWLPAWTPRVVIRHKSLTFRYRRMSIGPEHNQRRRRRILERLLSQALERLRGYSLRVGNDAMNYLAAEDIRLVLLYPADAVSDRFGYKIEDRQHQQNHAGRCPIFERSN